MEGLIRILFFGGSFGRLFLYVFFFMFFLGVRGSFGFRVGYVGWVIINLYNFIVLVIGSGLGLV